MELVIGGLNLASDHWFIFEPVDVDRIFAVIKEVFSLLLFLLLTIKLQTMYHDLKVTIQ